MLNLKDIRTRPEEYKLTLARKGVKASMIDLILVLDEQKRTLQQKTEALKAEQNAASKQIPTLEGDAKKALLDSMKQLSSDRKAAQAELDTVEAELTEKLESLPNPPHADAPDGKDDTENVVIKTMGEKPAFDFPIKEHWELAEDMGVLDTERSAKVSGSRFYYLFGELALLQRALMQWAFMEVSKKGFTATIPPFVTRKEAIHGTGYLEKGENYVINPGEDDLYLIGTSEVPMVSLHADEILEHGVKRYVAYSPCFRKEAGSYGKDTKGIFRVHQFEKVEMVVFAPPGMDAELHEEIRSIEEELLTKLGIHYQVVNVCTGDLGGSAAKKYDLEAWLPGQQQFREMTSTSICTDYQARRLNIRIRMPDGSIQHAHILNGTAVSSRPLVAILENFQQADGSVIIPEVLRPYCGFDVMRGTKR